MMKIRTAMMPLALYASMLLILIAIPACTSRPAEADAMTRDVFQAYIGSDYTKYVNSFAEELRRDADNREQYDEEIAAITQRFGEYVTDSLKYWKTEKEEPLIIVYYKARFTVDPEVIAKTVFQEIDGELTLFGFWLSSR